MPSRPIPLCSCRRAQCWEGDARQERGGGGARGEGRTGVGKGGDGGPAGEGIGGGGHTGVERGVERDRE